jgi:hypothetical protein
MKEIDNRKCFLSDMMDEGDIPDIILSQIAEMMECEAKAPGTILTYLYLLNQLITRQLVRITVVDSDYYTDIFHCNC